MAESVADGCDTAPRRSRHAGECAGQRQAFLRRVDPRPIERHVVPVQTGELERADAQPAAQIGHRLDHGSIAERAGQSIGDEVEIPPRNAVRRVDRQHQVQLHGRLGEARPQTAAQANRKPGQSGTAGNPQSARHAAMLTDLVTEGRLCCAVISVKNAIVQLRKRLWGYAEGAR